MHLKPAPTVFALAAVSFAVVTAATPQSTWLSLATLSLSSGVAALSLMGAAAVLGSRWQFVEALFGGLDRVYRTHKWLGVWALVFASIHLVFKAGADSWETASIISLPPFYTRLVRQLSFVALMMIIVLALNRAIPYRVWRWWHKLSGPLFLLVILHWISFKSPIRIDSPAGVWLTVMSALGVAGAAYKLLLYPFVSRHAEYWIAGVTPGAAALHLEMEPVEHPVSFEAGQFAFIRMKEDGLREPHPFTIASGPDKGTGRVDFMIRSLGDYTQKLVREARVGMFADIYAPYGRFKRIADARREIWIGGGVGISPFIAWLSDESAGSLEKTTLFYFFTPGREFPSVGVLKDLASRRGAECVTVSTGPASAEFRRRFNDIVQSAGARETAISFCGPKGLLDAIRALMREQGVPQTNLQYEYFDFR